MVVFTIIIIFERELSLNSHILNKYLSKKLNNNFTYFNVEFDNTNISMGSKLYNLKIQVENL